MKTDAWNRYWKLILFYSCRSPAQGRVYEWHAVETVRHSLDECDRKGLIRAVKVTHSEHQELHDLIAQIQAEGLPQYTASDYFSPKVRRMASDDAVISSAFDDLQELEKRAGNAIGQGHRGYDIMQIIKE